MKIPETSPETYKLLMYEEMHDLVLDELTGLLLYVRETPIIGLQVKELCTICFEPLGGPNLFNRKSALLLTEIEAHQSRWRGPIDEKKFNREYKLSGLKRP